MPDEEILLSIYVSVNCIVHALTPTITGLLESMEGEYFQVWSFNPRCLTKKTAPTSPSGQCPVTTNPSPPCWHSFSLPISRTRVNYRKRRRCVQVLFATNIAMALVNDWSEVPSSASQGMCGRQKRIEIRIKRITCMAFKKLWLSWMTFFFLYLLCPK
jgi:hypothetical protein